MVKREAESLEINNDIEFKCAFAKYFEYVPLSEIEKYIEFDREVEHKISKKYLDELTEEIKVNGITYPITLEVYVDKGLIVEGNHRIAVAKRLGIKHIPVRVVERSRPIKGTMYENKFKELPSRKNMEWAKVMYSVSFLDSENSASVYGFTKVEPNYKNGGEVNDKIDCPNCSGSGEIKLYEHIEGGKCFTCGGKGYVYKHKLEESIERKKQRIEKKKQQIELDKIKSEENANERRKLAEEFNQKIIDLRVEKASSNDFTKRDEFDTVSRILEITKGNGAESFMETLKDYTRFLNFISKYSSSELAYSFEKYMREKYNFNYLQPSDNLWEFSGLSEEEQVIFDEYLKKDESIGRNYESGGLIESDNFTKWFSGSKVVDEFGKPKTVFHGTNRKFNVFDSKEIGQGTGNFGHYGYGFYFSDDIIEAKGYGNIILECYLNIKKPFTGTDEEFDLLKAEGFAGIDNKVPLSIDFNDLHEKMKLVDSNAYKFMSISKENGIDNVWSIYLQSHPHPHNHKIDLNDIYDILGYTDLFNQNNAVSDYAIEELNSFGIEPKLNYGYQYSQSLHWVTDLGNNSKSFTDFIKSLGYDGVIYGSEYVAFYPNQIKLSDGTNTDFDSENPDIRFEKGGEIVLKNNGEKYETERSKSYADVEKNNDHWHIEYIESKSKGDGGNIIKKIIEDAKINGIHKLTLTAIDSSINFFKKFGFKVKSKGDNDTFMELFMSDEFKNGGELIDEKVTFDNFHKGTTADFKEIMKEGIPKRKPDFISDFGSKYWFTANSVIRQSDHWGTLDTCTWTLDGNSGHKITQGICNINEFKK